MLLYLKMSSFRLLRRLINGPWSSAPPKENPILLGRWDSMHSLRKSELSNHDHCGTCPTILVGPVGPVGLPAENEPKWTPELCKHLKYDNTSDIYCSIYVNKK